MTTAEINKELFDRAVLLHRAGGALWNDFFTALKAVEADAADMLVRSPPENLAKAQGRAQALRDLRIMLEKA